MTEDNTVKVDFSLTYTPKEEYNEIGYHTTLSCYKDSIIENGFWVSNESDDWLGEGVYFWDNENNARWWKKNSGIFKKCIFTCDLKCPLSNYLNLDLEMKKFESYLNEYMNSSYGKRLAKPKFKNVNECKKFYCDLYCSRNNICILSFSFEHDIINKFGFKAGTIKRRQICVRNPKCISINSVREG